MFYLPRKDLTKPCELVGTRQGEQFLTPGLWSRRRRDQATWFVISLWPTMSLKTMSNKRSKWYFESCLILKHVQGTFTYSPTHAQLPLSPLPAPWFSGEMGIDFTSWLSSWSLDFLAADVSELLRIILLVVSRALMSVARLSEAAAVQCSKLFMANFIF